MELKDSSDHRCYMSPYGIPTIQLGNGDIKICDLSFDDGFTGVGFALGDEGEIGRELEVEDGTMAAEFGVFMQVISSTPESLQVLIDRLTEAKAKFPA